MPEDLLTVNTSQLLEVLTFVKGRNWRREDSAVGYDGTHLLITHERSQRSGKVEAIGHWSAVPVRCRMSDLWRVACFVGGDRPELKLRLAPNGIHFETLVVHLA